MASTRRCAAVAVDIPIGLTEGPEPRPPDIEARRVLGQRASSVFPAPVRPAMQARTYEKACTISLRVSGRKMSKQSFALIDKIRQADRVMTPELQERVVEVHPEVSFWALNGGQAMAHKKKSAAGKQERLQLLTRVFQDGLASVAVPAGAGRDDLLDACVAAWTAWRLAHGRAERLPSDPPVDARGLRMAIVY